MVRRLFAAAALMTGGCAQLIGADDPEAAYQIDPDIIGDYLFAFHSDQTPGPATYTFFAELDNLDVDARTFDLVLHALDVRVDDRSLVGDEFAFEGNVLGNNDTFGFTIDQLDVVIDDAATPDTLGEVEIDAVLDAQFPILDGAHATTSGFCGVIEGASLSPKASLQDVTFAAFKAEFPTSAAPKVSCADLQP
jgi:hypothetical protein